jgi:hypothetical protein
MGRRDKRTESISLNPAIPKENLYSCFDERASGMLVPFEEHIEIPEVRGWFVGKEEEGRYVRG